MKSLLQNSTTILLGIMIFLLLLLGYKSAKLRKIAAELMEKKADLEIDRITVKVQELQRKAKETDAKRRESADAYRAYLESQRKS